MFHLIIIGLLHQITRKYTSRYLLKFTYLLSMKSHDLKVFYFSANTGLQGIDFHLNLDLWRWIRVSLSGAGLFAIFLGRGLGGLATGSFVFLTCQYAVTTSSNNSCAKLR